MPILEDQLPLSTAISPICVACTMTLPHYQTGASWSGAASDVGPPHVGLIDHRGAGHAVRPPRARWVVALHPGPRAIAVRARVTPRSSARAAVELPHWQEDRRV